MLVTYLRVSREPTPLSSFQWGVEGFQLPFHGVFRQCVNFQEFYQSHRTKVLLKKFYLKGHVKTFYPQV